MNEQADATCQAATIAAVEDNLFAFLRLFGAWDRVEIHDRPECLASITDIPFAMFNSIMRARIPDGEVERVVGEVVARGRARKVPLLWWTGPSTRPADLPQRLKAHGFMREGEAPGMAMALAALQAPGSAPQGFVFERVADEATLRACCHVMAQGFGLPDFVEAAFFQLFLAAGLGAQAPLAHYIGFLDGAPVAASSVLIAAGAAGVYNVATLKEARGKGVGALMTALPLLEARAQGCALAILHSSALGLSVYRRLGFREVCRIGQHQWSEPDAD